MSLHKNETDFLVAYGNGFLTRHQTGKLACLPAGRKPVQSSTSSASLVVAHVLTGRHHCHGSETIWLSVHPFLLIPLDGNGGNKGESKNDTQAFTVQLLRNWSQCRYHVSYDALHSAKNIITIDGRKGSKRKIGKGQLNLGCPGAFNDETEWGSVGTATTQICFKLGFKLLKIDSPHEMLLILDAWSYGVQGKKFHWKIMC